jgi:hypothetical protein
MTDDLPNEPLAVGRCGQSDTSRQCILARVWWSILSLIASLSVPPTGFPGGYFSVALFAAEVAHTFC